MTLSDLLLLLFKKEILWVNRFRCSLKKIGRERIALATLYKGAMWVIWSWFAHSLLKHQQFAQKNRVFQHIFYHFSLFFPFFYAQVRIPPVANRYFTLSLTKKLGIRLKNQRANCQPWEIVEIFQEKVFCFIQSFLASLFVNSGKIWKLLRISKDIREYNAQSIFV